VPVVVLGGDHFDFGQHVVVDVDPEPVDFLDQPVGAARFNVRDEDVGSRVSCLVHLLDDPANAVVSAQHLSELLGPVVGDGGAQPQHPVLRRPA
jgi:hypothetical protein